ncbi:methylmalonic aciduria and homocystinuria type D homolog, mitochondrial-like [Oppia nitens]|uniref:methylmalonic aciduria and homocystinuria type D homolog, mitochondrial-like n=1 Tax=Oppia nitens TaxID=1686743 RepID=UPI0023DAA108|nr:methylmalonic aciduria and homocystinuria type D homolog, mitochondrial-like [Oppia nitens]
MLRLNRLLVSKHLNKVSNVLTNSCYNYSSEAPDKWSSFERQHNDRQQTLLLNTDFCDHFLRITKPELHLFGPHDMRAPLNGNIGITLEDTNEIHKKFVIELVKQMNTFEQTLPSIDKRDIDLFLSNNTFNNRCLKIFRVLKYQTLFNQKMMTTCDVCDIKATKLLTKVMKNFALLFPRKIRQEFGDNMTVMTISEKTSNDMSSYSETIENEREKFFEMFIIKAKNVCQELQNHGFWADFIDPYSGQPFLSDHTNDTLFETDDRFIHLGFRIEDLGCCKAIHHNKWGTHVIVGTIFTSAPTESPILIKLMSEMANKK